MTSGRRALIEMACGAVIGAALIGLKRFAGPPTAWLDRALLSMWQFKATILAWLVFSVYWEIAGKRAAKATRSESGLSRGVHVMLVNVALLVTIAPIHGLGRLLPLSNAGMTTGLAMEVSGLCFAIWARVRLGRNWSGEISIKEDHELIRSGPYRWLRHPIYTGLLTMYVGTALVTGERLAIGGMAMAALAYWRKIRLEEENLHVAFGAEYEGYRRATWALVPGVY